jgi:hypothetical protein
VGPLPVEDTLELHRLVRDYCTIMCRLLVSEGDPRRLAVCSIYFGIARRPLAEALRLFALAEPDVFRVLVDEAIHPGGGV